MLERPLPILPCSKAVWRLAFGRLPRRSQMRLGIVGSIASNGATRPVP